MIPANNHPEIDRLIHLKKHLGGMTMSKLISCQFNTDTACVELVLMMEASFPLTAPPLKTKLPTTASSGQSWIIWSTMTRLLMQTWFWTVIPKHTWKQWRNISLSIADGKAIAQQPTAVNGQDERFAPLTAAACRAFWADKAGRCRLCLPANIQY